MRGNENDVHESVCLVFGRNLPHLSVGNLPGEAAEFLPAVLGDDVSPVGESVECLAPAFREDDVLEEPFAVDLRMADLVVVRYYLAGGQPHAFQPARSGTLTRKFRVRVHALRAVHRPGAASHDQAVEALQEFFKADLVKETVLRRDMAAAEDDPVRAVDQRFSAVRIAAVQHRHLRRLDAGLADALRHRFEHVVGEAAVVGRRADEQHPRPLRQRRPHLLQQAVVFSETVLPVPGRTSRQNKRHQNSIYAIAKITSFFLIAPTYPRISTFRPFEPHSPPQKSVIEGPIRGPSTAFRGVFVVEGPSRRPSTTPEVL